MTTIVKALFHRRVYWPHAALLVAAIIPIYLMRNVDVHLPVLLSALWLSSTLVLMMLLVALTSFQSNLSSTTASLMEAVVWKIDRLTVFLIVGLGAFALLKKSIGYEMLYPEDVIFLSGWLIAGFFAFYKVRGMTNDEHRKVARFIYAAFMVAPYAMTIFAWMVYPYTY